MTLAQRMNRVLVRMMRYQEAGAIDYSRAKVSQGRGGHGKHGATSSPPSFGGSVPLVVEWSDRFELLIAQAEGDADAYERGSTRTAPSTADLKTRIRDYAGRDPVFVAFVEQCSVDTVKRARRDLGLKTSDGHPYQPDERPLTAPPREVLRQLEERAAGAALVGPSKENNDGA